MPTMRLSNKKMSFDFLPSVIDVYKCFSCMTTTSPMTANSNTSALAVSFGGHSHGRGHKLFGARFDRPSHKCDYCGCTNQSEDKCQEKHKKPE